ncbi:unnamed protein product, partial [Prunus brigantina]
MFKGCKSLIVHSQDPFITYQNNIHNFRNILVNMLCYGSATDMIDNDTTILRFSLSCVCLRNSDIHAKLE